MIAEIITILSSSGFGAITGFFGSWMTKRENRLNKELDQNHELAMAKIDLVEGREERAHALALADKELEITETEGEIEQDIAETEAFTQSLEVQKIKSGIKWVDAVRFLMRPFVTVYLLAIASYFAYNVHQLVNGLESLPLEQVVTLYTQLISQLMFLTTTAVTWWFGSRGDKAK